MFVYIFVFGGKHSRLGKTSLVLGEEKKKSGMTRQTRAIPLADKMLFEEFFKPIGNLVQAADAVIGFTASAQLMVFAVEHAQAAFHPVDLECGEHLEPFHQPAAVVLIRGGFPPRGP